MFVGGVCLGFGVLFLSCVCVGVGGVVLCRCVCVCDLLIFYKNHITHAHPTPTRIGYESLLTLYIDLLIYLSGL